MPKVKKHKVNKSHLTTEEKKLGKMHIYVLVGIIVVGLAFGLYHMQ